MSVDLDFDMERVGAICRRYGVARLDVFGSAARGELGPESDIDLLYELAPGTRLGWHIEDLAEELSDAPGRPADLVSRSALHERMRDDVLAESQAIYAA